MFDTIKSVKCHAIRIDIVISIDFTVIFNELCDFFMYVEI